MRHENTSKAITMALSVLFLAAGLSSQELTFDFADAMTATDASTDSLVFDGQINAALDLPLDQVHRFQMQGGVQYNLDALAADPSAGRQIIEYFYLKQLRLSGSVPGDDKGLKGISWELGRTYLEDPSKSVFAGTYDGFKLSTLFAFGSIDATLGTTMLLPKRESGITLSLADLATAANNNDTLASARVFGSLEGVIELGGGHILKPFFAFQEDLNELKGYPVASPGTTSYSGVSGAALDSQYMGANLSGMIGQLVAYDASCIFETGRTLSWLADSDSPTGASYQWAPVYAGLVSTNWDFNLDMVLQSTLSTGLMIGTGDPDAATYYEGNTAGDYNQFFALVSNQFSQILSAASGNMAAWNVAWTVRPWKNAPTYALQTLSGTVSLATLFRTSTGALPVEGIASGSGNMYLGEEFALGAVWRPVPDMRLNLGMAMLVPAAGTAGAFDNAFAAENPVMFKFKLGMNLYF